MDVDSVVRPGQLGVDVEALQRDLPEDIRTGLNWSVDKQDLFLLSVFTPTPDPAGGPEMNVADLGETPEENAAASDAVEFQELLGLFPQAADKEAAALIQARNSVVAASLWRRYAAETRLAMNQIRIDPGCGVMGMEQEQSE